MENYVNLLPLISKAKDGDNEAMEKNCSNSFKEC